MLCVVNLDPKRTHRGWLDLDLEVLGLPDDAGYQVHDLLADVRFTWQGRRNFVGLDPSVMSAHEFALRRFVRTDQFEYFL